MVKNETKFLYNTIDEFFYLTKSNIKFKMVNIGQHLTLSFPSLVIIIPKSHISEKFVCIANDVFIMT